MLAQRAEQRCDARAVPGLKKSGVCEGDGMTTRSAWDLLAGSGGAWMRSVVWLGGILLGGFGCGGTASPSGVALAQLRHPWMHVEPLDILDAHDDDVMGLVVESDGCTALRSSVTATVNGEPMALLYPGGVAGQAADGGCTRTTFRTPSFLGHPPGDVDFMLTDGTTTWRMTVTALYATRSVVIPASYTSSGQAGQMLVLQWLPVSDVFDPRLGTGFDLQFDAVMSATPTWDITDPVAITVDGSFIRTVIPPPVADAIRGVENGALHFRGYAHAGVSHCTGIGTCVADVRIVNAPPLPFQVTVN